ncbi:hypothetical protein CFO_g4142 [Ceratocystis platani]|uniref:COP9 signalosome complex subunit 12 n=1 Tax=Ceratocystis fimbriata f. sp. platani TaxID=88771 RepID=A0A0F8BM71_CERFI|nr:hypothetical protein CFO_g4142 [Ceratocystis platani]
MSLLLQFLSTILDYVHKQDGPSLGAWLKVEPTASEQYFKLAQELRSQFRDAAAVESTVAKCFPDEDPVEVLTGAASCSTCGVAFANPTYGGMLLETCMSLSEALSRLTLALNKRPDLMARQKGGGGGEEERKTIAEVCAEILQKIFTTCLTDRSSARNARPEGKKVGVYMFANLTLKLLFACRRKQLAQQIFTNIETNSPPLSLYPAAQRVTFLFYLGRFWLSNNSYSRASLALDEAYRQTPRVCVSQRALILSYLVPCNILIGRLPSPALLQRPEMQEIAPLYGGLSAALKLLPHEGVVNGSQEITTEGIELIVSSLIDMELMHGYISHSLRKFALFRGKNMPIATAGWPTVAPAIRDRKYDEDFEMTAVPGWVRS